MARFTREFTGTVINFRAGYKDELLMEIHSHDSRQIFVAAVCKYSQNVELGDTVKFHVDRMAATNVTPVEKSEG